MSTATINVRIPAAEKSKAEAILSAAGFETVSEGAF